MPEAPPSADQEQYRQALAELARLARQELPPEQFYSLFLSQLVRVTGAEAGAVWLREGSGGLNQRGQLRFSALGMEQGSPEWTRHARLLLHILQTRRNGMVPPGSGMQDAGETAANPTKFTLSLCPFALAKEHFGVVELCYPHGFDEEDQNERIRVLGRAAECLVEFQRNLEVRRMTGRQQLLSKVDTFAEHVHSDLAPRATAFTIANDGRQLIGCDRVSVACLHGNRTVVEAISGQDQVDPRANLVRLMARLADAVIRHGDPLSYTAGSGEFPPRIEKLLQEYLEESASKTILILPLREHAPSGQPLRKPYGALVIEQIEDEQDASELAERAEAVKRHGGAALANALRHHRVFLRPVFEWLGQRFASLRGRVLYKWLAVLLVIGGITAGLCVVPAPFRLEGEGRLLPEVRRNVFAAEDGIVRAVETKHGARVEAGDELVKIENIDLEVRLQQARAELLQVQDEYNIKNAQRGERSLTPVEEIQISGQLVGLKGKIESLKKEIELLQTRIGRLTVHAPLGGVVLTWDLARNLQDRPVQRGQHLLSLADDKQAWQLEVRLPEDRAGHVARAVAQLPAGERLPVEFILATQPEVRYHGWVREIGERTEFLKEKNVVLLTVDLDPAALPPLRPAAEVRARVVCGKAAVGYVWFHELIEFVYARVLFLF